MGTSRRRECAPLIAPAAKKTKTPSFPREQPTHSTPTPFCCSLDYPGVGPEHSFLKDIGRAEYHAVTGAQPLLPPCLLYGPACPCLSECEASAGQLMPATSCSSGL